MTKNWWRDQCNQWAMCLARTGQWYVRQDVAHPGSICRCVLPTCYEIAMRFGGHCLPPKPVIWELLGDWKKQCLLIVLSRQLMLWFRQMCHQRPWMSHQKWSQRPLLRLNWTLWPPYHLWLLFCMPAKTTPSETQAWLSSILSQIWLAARMAFFILARPPTKDSHRPFSILREDRKPTPSTLLPHDQWL